MFRLKLAGGLVLCSNETTSMSHATTIRDNVTLKRFTSKIGKSSGDPRRYPFINSSDRRESLVPTMNALLFLLVTARRSNPDDSGPT